jgi:hypothetical protein
MPEGKSRQKKSRFPVTTYDTFMKRRGINVMINEINTGWGKLIPWNLSGSSGRVGAW